MDDFVKNILKAWELEDIIPLLKFYKIDETKFNNISLEEINDMFPPTKDKHKSIFKNKFREYLINLPKQDDVILNENKENLTVDNSNQNKSSGNESMDDPVANDQSSINEIEVITCSEKLLKFLAIDENFTPIEKNMPLFKLLSGTLMGRLILFSYIDHKNLLRRELCKIIVENEMLVTITTSVPFSLNRDKFIQLTKSIQDLFKYETEPDLYYSPSYYIEDANHTKKKVSSTGLLFAAYNSYRDKLGESGLLGGIKRRASNKSNKQQEFFEFNVDSDLLYSEFPNNDDDAIATWKSSYYQRHDNLYKNKTGLQIFDKFLLLKSHLFPILIEHDFEQLLLNHKNKPTDNFKNNQISERLIVNWEQFAQKLIKYVTKTFDTPVVVGNNSSTVVAQENNVNASNTPQKHNAGASNTLVEQEKQTNKPSSAKKRKKCNDNSSEVINLVAENLPLESIEHKNVLALLLLPKLINYTTKHKLNHDQFTSYIVHLKEYEQNAFLNFMQQRQEFYTNLNIKVLHPYVIICGPLKNIQSSFVIVNETMYMCDSPLKAVDLSFKSFFSLRLDYSVGCPHVWSFFQKCFYEIRGHKQIVAATKIVELFLLVNEAT